MSSDGLAAVARFREGDGCNAQRHQQDERDVAGEPELGLRVEAEMRLDERRVREEPKGASQVAGEVEEIRIRRVAVIGPREEVLDERRGR